MKVKIPPKRVTQTIGRKNFLVFVKKNSGKTIAMMWQRCHGIAPIKVSFLVAISRIVLKILKNSII